MHAQAAPDGPAAQVIRASLGEQVVAKTFAPPVGLDAMLVHLQLSILGKRAVVAAGGEVNALDLTRHITRTFQSQACACTLEAAVAQRRPAPLVPLHARPEAPISCTHRLFVKAERGWTVRGRRVLA